MRGFIAIIAVGFFAGALPCVQGAQFRRGDANLDQLVDISDAVKILGVLFLGEPPPDCYDAMDVNDDGRLDLSDGIYPLTFLFLSGPVIPEPFQKCGEDPTEDLIACASHPYCPQCMGQDDLDEMLREGVDPEVCIEPDTGKTTIQIGLLTVTFTVCPSASAQTCGIDNLPGCRIQITEVNGVLDVPGSKVTIHIEGKTDDLPLLIEGDLGTTTCLNDVTFSGDAAMVLVTEPVDAKRVKIVDVLDPTVESVAMDLTSTGGLACSFIQSNKDMLIEEFTPQIEESMKAALAEQRPQLIGAFLCLP